MCKYKYLSTFSKIILTKHAHIAYILSLLTNYPYIYFRYLCVKYETVATQPHILMTSALYLYTKKQ